MTKLDEFKDFVKNNPFLLEKIRSKETTWQNMYETYDIYGKEHVMFKNTPPPSQQSQTNHANLFSTEGINGALKAFQGLDMDKLSSNLDGVKKFIGAFQEITKPEVKGSAKIPSYMKKSNYRRYND